MRSKLVTLVVTSFTVVAFLFAPSVAYSANQVSEAHSSKRVCDVPDVGSAACQARVVTLKSDNSPMATRMLTSGYGPSQLQTAYGAVTPVTGTSPVVAVVDAYAHPNPLSDLNAYRAQFGLPALDSTKFKQYNQTGGIQMPQGNVSWGQEEMLDLEMVTALCPSCSIIYVGAKSASYTDLAAAVTTAKNKGAVAISNSYAGSEFSTEANMTAWNIPNVAVTVASGDNGYGTLFPAASAGVIAVGGTSLTLTSASKRASETAWSGAGSGCSLYIAKPAYQADTGCSKRAIADVSAVADPATGVAVYDTYGSKLGNNWYVFGGTSVATPIVAALLAAAGKTKVSNASAFYKSPSALFDVTSGSNGICSTAYLCNAAVGYDGPTGNGAALSGFSNLVVG